jgi:hypothetical protein
MIPKMVIEKARRKNRKGMRSVQYRTHCAPDLVEVGSFYVRWIQIFCPRISFVVSKIIGHNLVLTIRRHRNRVR